MKSHSPPPVPSASSVRPSPLFAYDGFHHYLPIPDDLFRAGIYVTSAGRGVVHPGECYPPAPHPQLYQFKWSEGRILPEFSFILITSGTGMFESRATGQIPIGAGMAILLFPGTWHRYQPDPDVGWTEQWIQFNGEFVHRLWEQKMIAPERAVLRPAELRAVQSVLERLLNQIHIDSYSNSLFHSMQALSVLTLALCDAPVASSAWPKTPPKAPKDPLVAAALDIIWTRSHQVLSVEDVAALLGVNRRTLERRMAATLGRSVLDEIISCRFSRAERLLRETELPIKTVVSLAGFGSVESLRQVFVKRTQLPPAEYRRHLTRPLKNRGDGQGENILPTISP
jgi:AraC-like DNA-binding protein